MSKFLKVLENHTPSNNQTLALHGKIDLQNFFEDHGVTVDRDFKDYAVPSFNITLGDKIYRLTVEYIGDAGEQGEEEAESFANKDQQTANELKAADAATSSTSDPATIQAKKRLGATVTNTFNKLSNKLSTTASKI